MCQISTCDLRLGSDSTDTDRSPWAELVADQKWDKKYCDNVNGARRVVSVRTSLDGLAGRNFSDDWCVSMLVNW